MNQKQSCKREVEFSSLEVLKSIIINEPFFRVQVFSLESIEIFEKFLLKEDVAYCKQFSSQYEPSKKLLLLMQDSDFPESFKESKVILYSNLRDFRFIPYKFKLSEEEMKLLIPNEAKYQMFKNSTYTASAMERIDFHKHTAESLNCIQKHIVFCLIRTKSFGNLCKEIQQVNNALNNKFLIKCELNYMVKCRIIEKRGSSYTIKVSNETVQAICDSLGFGQALKH